MNQRRPDVKEIFAVITTILLPLLFLRTYRFGMNASSMFIPSIRYPAWVFVLTVSMLMMFPVLLSCSILLVVMKISTRFLSRTASIEE